MRQLREADLEQLLAIQSRPEVARFMYWPPRTRTEVEHWLRAALRPARFEAEGDALVVAAEERTSVRIAGTVTLFLRSRADQQGEIGFMFHPDFQGQGLATEATRVILNLGFEALGLHRIFGRCDGRNLASSRLMDRLGMRQEAKLIENEMVKGEWADEWIYAILSSEWRAASGVGG